MNTQFKPLVRLGVGSGGNGLSLTLKVFGWLCVVGAVVIIMKLGGDGAILTASCAASSAVFFALGAILEKVTFTAYQTDWMAKEIEILRNEAVVRKSEIAD